MAKSQTPPAPALSDDEIEAQEAAAREAAEAEAEAQREAAEMIRLAEEDARAKANARTQAEKAAEQRAIAEKNGPAKTLEDALGEPAEDTRGGIPDMLFVTDLTAADYKIPRVHTLIIDGEKVDFEFYKGKPIELPFAIACRFLIDGAFLIKDADGNTFKPSPKRIKTTDLQNLQADQVIAELRELTTEALYIRAVKFPDGEKLNRAMSRDQIITFLMAAHEAMDTGPGGGRERLFSGEYEDMDDAAAARLLGNAA